MGSPREFVQDVGSAAAPCAAYANIHHAVFDERFAAARAFAAEAARRGWAVSAIRGDISEFWRRDLAPAWRDGPVSLAGMTEDNSLYYLERLAREAGLAVICRRREAAEGLVSWTIGPPAVRS